jgi:hypothetical protein
MIVQITPTSVTNTSTSVEVTMPDFKLGSTEGNARVIFMTSEGAFIDLKHIPIPPEVYVQWGTDDNFIVNYVLQQLNLIATEE